MTSFRSSRASSESSPASIADEGTKGLAAKGNGETAGKPALEASDALETTSGRGALLEFRGKGDGRSFAPRLVIHCGLRKYRSGISSSSVSFGSSLVRDGDEEELGATVSTRSYASDWFGVPGDREEAKSERRVRPKRRLEITILMSHHMSSAITHLQQLTKVAAGVGVGSSSLLFEVPGLPSSK